MAKCAHHPIEDADRTCWKCDKGICESCFRASRRSLCADCARSRRRGRFVNIAALTVLGAGLAAGAAWRLASEAKNARYGEHAARILALQDQLQKEPCDAAAAIEVAELLIDAGVSREVLPMATAYRVRCGRQEQLLWKEYGAAKRTGKIILDKSNMIIKEKTTTTESTGTTESTFGNLPLTSKTVSKITVNVKAGE